MRPAEKIRVFRNPALFALVSLAAGHSLSVAAPVYWGQTAYSSGTTYEGTMATAENWFTDPAGTTVASVGPETLDDDLVFNTTPADEVGGTVTVSANFTANSFVFNTRGATVLAQDANRNILLGGGGITLNAASGNVSFGINVHTLNVRLAASQTWTNHSGSVLAVRNVTTSAGNGPVTLTLNAAGAGNLILPLSVADTLDDPLSVVVDSAGSGTVIMAAGSYSGGATVNRGKLSVSGTNDTGEILLGAESGADAATLAVASPSFPNAVTVRAGSSGGKVLVAGHAAGVLNGAITLGDTLSFVAAGKVTTLNGGVSGAGSLVKEGKGALILAGPNTFSGNVTVKAGSLTLAEAGSLTFVIGGGGPTNQMAGSGEASVTLNGTFLFQISGSAPPDGASWPLVTVPKKTFGPTFAITGFTQADDVWTNGAGFTFSESTGVLSYKRTP
jgi:fibronectin-binding autotransporter adhesin